MSDQAWEQLVDLIDQKYDIIKHKKHTEELPSGKQKLERLHDIVIFEKNGKKYKIDRVSSPAVLGTKTHYAHRGTAQRIEHEYDPGELVHKVYFYEQDHTDSWKEISPEDLA